MKTARARISTMSFGVFVLCLVALRAFATTPAAAPDGWETSVSPYTPGTFPEPRSIRAKYNFGWNGFTAATGDVRFAKTPDGRFQLEATGGTIGMARGLWRFDVKHSGICDARTLRPIEVTEVESTRKKNYTTKVAFTPERVISTQEQRRDSAKKTKIRSFDFPNVLSLDSALLYLRTQGLEQGSVHRIVIYPATSPYLSTVSVLGHEKITVPTGTYDALKVDLQLSKIGKTRQLEPHKKFRRATVWLSNDADRLILRIEAEVFVGAVFAELQSVQFDEPRPSIERQRP